MQKHNVFGFLWILVTAVGCAVNPTPTISPISPLQSPQAIVSPLETPSGSMVNFDLDLTQVMLQPADVSDLFQASYSITQPYSRSGVQGLQVIFPTRSELHGSTFAEGFSTQVEIYLDFEGAVKAFGAAVAAQKGQPYPMNTVGDVTRAFHSNEEGANVFTVVVRQVNALVIITVKTQQTVNANILEKLAQTVVKRLQP